jgi:hypothetical protein
MLCAEQSLELTPSVSAALINNHVSDMICIVHGTRFMKCLEMAMSMIGLSKETKWCTMKTLSNLS